MAIYYTEYHISDALEGNHDNLLDYRGECEEIAKKHFRLEGLEDTFKIIVFDFERKASIMFEFSAELYLQVTTY